MNWEAIVLTLKLAGLTALLLILIYLLVLAVFWTNTYLRIWRS